MADKKISQLTYKSELDGMDYVPIVSRGNPLETQHTLIRDIRNYTDYAGTLAAGSTSLNVLVGYNHHDPKIFVFTSVFGVNPTNVAYVNAHVQLTFEAQQTDVGVIVRVEG
jgi:hypothetical protein